MASRPQRGTGYIGLEQWLGQNQSQAAAIAGSLTDGIDAQGRKADALLGQAKEEFKYGADSSALNYDNGDLYNPDGSTATGSLPLARQRSRDADAFIEQGWKGPNTLDEVSAYGLGTGVARDAQNDANLASDFYGRQALLQDRAGKAGGYSLGQQRLDSALVGAAGGDRIDATKAQWGNLLGRFDTAANGAKSYAADVQGKNKAAADSYKADAVRLQEGADKVHDQTGKDAQAGNDAEKERARQERLQERERERQERLRERGTSDRGGGGKANVDRWMAESIGW